MQSPIKKDILIEVESIVCDILYNLEKVNYLNKSNPAINRPPILIIPQILDEVSMHSQITEEYISKAFNLTQKLDKVIESHFTQTKKGK